MADRFHLMSVQLMIDQIPGLEPTDEERSKFVKPSFDKVKDEAGIYIQLVSRNHCPIRSPHRR